MPAVPWPAPPWSPGDEEPSTTVVAVEAANQVGEARRAAAALAARLGFSEADAGRVALVATEAATNLARHATDGVLLVQSAPAAGPPLADGRAGEGAGAAAGVELVAVDRGPGIRDLARAAADGFSTGGTSGQGLGAMRRAADQFDLYSVPAPVPDPFAGAAAPDARRGPDTRAGSGTPVGAGAGTVVLARLWTGGTRTADRAARRAQGWRVGGVSVPLAGEPVCGDAWAACATRDGCRVLVADGLGHGRAAAEAAQLAVRLFRADVARGAATGTATALAALLEQLHVALRPTRGAAVAVAEVRAGAPGAGAPGEVRFAGVGNIAASVTGPDGESRSLVSHNGTVGHQLRKVQEFRVPWPAGAVLVLHSDGIRTQWRLGAAPGLARRDPTLVAAALWRDHARGRDDATVVVVRDAPGDPAYPSPS